MTRSTGMHAPAGPAGARGHRRVPALRRRLHSERGQAMVEMALVLPLLVLLVVGMLEFGRAINYWLDVNHLASEGARIESVGNPTGADLAAYLSSQATTSVQSCMRTTDENGDAKVGVGDSVTVEVSTPFDFLHVHLPNLFGKSDWAVADIVGSATFRLEAPPAVGSLPPCT